MIPVAAGCGVPRDTGIVRRARRATSGTETLFRARPLREMDARPWRANSKRRDADRRLDNNDVSHNHETSMLPRLHSNTNNSNSSTNSSSKAFFSSFLRSLIRFLRWGQSSCLLPIMIIATILLLSVFAWGGIVPTWSSSEPAAIIQLLTSSELESLLDAIRGDDFRLVRWNASPHTVQAQHTGGCRALSDALTVIVHGKDEEEEEKDAAKEKEDDNKAPRKTAPGLACEYATFCITDHPDFRATLSQHPGIYEAVVRLVESPHAHTSASASHLIYIASFANKDNHVGFFRANAIAALRQIIVNDDQPKEAQSRSRRRPVEIMWAAAALQNLLASYCDTPRNGRCYWLWHHGKDHVLIDRQSLPVISDGTSMRRVVMMDPELVHRLQDYACQGPVQRDEPSEDYPFPGVNARVDCPHEDAETILAWAAAGVLKNLALEPDAKARYVSPQNVTLTACLCRLAHSSDWLEENKGQGVLHHTRPADPCWFEGQSQQDADTSRADYVHGSLCVDYLFEDDEGYACDSYGGASAQDCQATDVATGTVATVACCACGGGVHFAGSSSSHGRFDANNNGVDAIKREL